MSTEAAARAWAESLAPVTDAMLDLARPMPGERVLDVGAGAGQFALQIAARVGASGEVLAVDPSSEAIASIERVAAGAADRAPVRTLVAGAESLDAGEARFDLAVARNSVMYFADLERGLANVRRALRPGGRLVASVYGPLASEPFHAIPLAAVTRRTALAPPMPEYAAAFGLDAVRLQDALSRCGFQAVTRTDVPVRRSYPDRAALDASLRGSGSLEALLARLPSGERAAAWREIDAGFERYAGATGIVIPGLQVVVAAVA